MTRPLAERVVEAWVRLYTFALPVDIAEARRNELRSDLWDHRAQGGYGVLRRALAGAPADLTWRVTQGIVAPWLRRPLRLTVGAAVLITLAQIQHATGRHTFIGNAMYVSWFICTFAAVGAFVVQGWRRYKR